MELTYDEIKLGLGYAKAVLSEIVPLPRTVETLQTLYKCMDKSKDKGCEINEFLVACIDKAETALWLQEER